jgi:hypothetical protein
MKALVYHYHGPAEKFPTASSCAPSWYAQEATWPTSR